MHDAKNSCNAESYRRCRRAVANGPGTLQQQIAALSAFLDLQDDERLTGATRERRWLVVHALAIVSSSMEAGR